MPESKHYLRDAKTGEKIELETSGKRLSVLFKDDDLMAFKKTLSELEKIALNASLKKISSRVYEIEYINNPTDEEIKEVKGRLQKELTNAIPYNVYKAKDQYGLIYTTDEIIVTFSAGTSADTIRLLEEKYNLIKLDEYSDDQLVCVFGQKPGNWVNPIEVANNMENENGVENAEPNLINRLINTSTLTRPTDDFFRKQWQLETNNQPNVFVNADVNAREAWDRLNSGGDPNVVIAVVDFGFDLTHPDLVNKIVKPNEINETSLDRFDFAEKAGAPKFPKPRTLFEDHGTSCAGIAVAEKNENGVVGVAFDCKFLPVRCPDDPSNFELCKIFRAIRNKADVISCSYAPEVSAAASPALNRLIEKIAKSEGRQGQGCVICFAAGNANLPLDEMVDKPTIFVKGRPQQLDFTGRVLNPYASNGNVIAVAASTAKNKKAMYSNWGKEIWVCAPSNDIEEEDGAFIEPSITTTSSRGNLGNNLYTDKFTGTSAATPLVAGIAALIISANPTLTADEVKDIIKKTADKINPNDNPDGKYDNDGRSKWYGFGKVNAGRAVEMALGMRS